MFTANINVSVSGQIGGSYSSASAISSGLRQSLFEAIPANATTRLVFDLDVSEIKMLAIRSDRPVTIKTNSATSPDNTFVLVADQSFLWPLGEGALKDTGGALVADDITSLHVVNTGAAGTLRVDAFVDPTPAVAPIVDTTAPVISLIGASTITLSVGGTFTDPGANVTDNIDAARTITGTGTVNTAVAGTYTRTYATSDAAGNAATPVTRTVIVAAPVDTTVPVIALIGDATINLSVGDSFTDPGANVTDNIDGARTITGTGAVDTAVAGTYTLTYATSDAAGNAATSVTRTVIVA